jgi:hypothetical protein
MSQHRINLNHELNWDTPREIYYLAFAALPISIYVLAIVILEQGDFGSMVLESKLATITHAAKNRSVPELFVEGRLRVLWLSSVVLYYILAIAVFVTCLVGVVTT